MSENNARKELIEKFNKYREIGIAVRLSIGNTVPEQAFLGAMIYLLDGVFEKENILIEELKQNNELLKELIATKSNNNSVAEATVEPQTPTGKTKVSTSKKVNET